MSITVTIDLSDRDLEHFQKAMETSRKAAEGKTPDEVVAAAGKLAALVETAKIPHPGRGANVMHKQFGPVWATGHLGDDVVSLISTASDKPEHAKFKAHNWKVVQELKMPGAGNLFVKTHPKSAHFWADAPMNPEREVAESVSVFSLDDMSKEPVQLNRTEEHQSELTSQTSIS